MVDELPAKLRSEIVLQRYQRTVDRIPFFRNLTEDNLENQAFIAAIERQPRAVADPDVLGCESLQVAVDRATGKVSLERRAQPS